MSDVWSCILLWSFGTCKLNMVIIRVQELEAVLNLYALKKGTFNNYVETPLLPLCSIECTRHQEWHSLAFQQSVVYHTFYLMAELTVLPRKRTPLHFCVEVRRILWNTMLSQKPVKFALIFRVPRRMRTDSLCILFK